ncbi:unnamed protein product [Eruca vesicaria subsp. sativa]|uniref:Uncharacterized protein n=1 Tax=Eruca vesicaria subsp. sativa TaxID=29727 RepID=A0ABC8KIB3_ERUVS|nr:unnamed protein product [Eruca vesicaria subsp. sativa]
MESILNIQIYHGVLYHTTLKESYQTLLTLCHRIILTLRLLSSVVLPTQHKPKGVYNARPGVQEVILAPDTSRDKRDMKDYLGKYVFFKRFDIVEDLVDHQYALKEQLQKSIQRNGLRGSKKSGGFLRMICQYPTTKRDRLAHRA